MKAHTTYLIYLVLYVSAIATLLYYLIDNVIQKSKLTPRRMKVWCVLLILFRGNISEVFDMVSWYKIQPLYP